MSKIWTKYLRGTVKITVEGDHAENFLNYCLHNKIQIWEIERREHLVLHMFTDDALKIRIPLRRMGCRFKVMRRSGAPLLVRRMISRSGFVAGLGIFFVLVFLLSNMVWGIEITGADPKTEHHLRKILDEIGVQKGKLLFQIPDPQEVQYLATEKMDEVTWIGVTLKGTTFHFKVVQKELPEEIESKGAQNLVAKKKAFIRDMYIEQGQVKVERNQLVHEGDLLVSGQIGKDKNARTVPAKGKVFGEVWYHAQVNVPLKTTFDTLTGNHDSKHYLSLFGWDLPIWGFGKVGFDEYEVMEETKTLRIFRWDLPITYVKRNIQESESVQRDYTVEQAIEIAKKRADEDMESQLPEEGKIKSGKILHHRVDNGKVNVSIFYKVIENIAEEQPIIGGD